MTQRNNNPALADVYDVIKDIKGVFDLRHSDYHISYIANVTVVTAILNALTEAFGEPTENHPLVATIDWYLMDKSIRLHKAAGDSDAIGVIHNLFSFPR